MRVRIDAYVYNHRTRVTYSNNCDYGWYDNQNHHGMEILKRGKRNMGIQYQLKQE